MTKLRITLILFTFACVSFGLQAETYPVVIATQSIPPHTGNIADWTAPGSNKLSVNILLQDANEVNYQVQLHVKIEGQGITLRTRRDFNQDPISLRYGVPTQLNGPDLAGILHYENLIFENYSIQQYEANGGLPDGMYQVCFEVFDYNRIDEEPASLESCVTIFASLHKTPVILAPIGDVNPLYPQFVPVQWQARHHGGFPTQYNVEIYEYDPNSGLTPELIIDFEQPYILKEVTSMTSSIVDASDPQLVPGRQYIVRVQATDLTQQNGFKNNGWSDFEIFTYGTDECPAPFNIKTEDIEVNTATVSWDEVPGDFNNSYVIRYRNKYKPNAQWYEDETNLSSWEITNLKENTIYEYQMYTLCGGTNAGVYSVIDTFTTDTIPVFLDCDVPNSLPQITNQNPVDSLSEDMIITIADFKIYIDSAEVSNDLWTGTGAIYIPWINTYINVEFTDIAVNTDRKVYAGEVYAVSQGLDVLPGFITATDLAAERNAPEVEVCDDGSGASETDETNADAEEEEEDAEREIAEGTIFVAGAGIGSTNLPFGLTSNSTNNTYIIALDSMVFTPQGATLKSYMALDVPSGGGDKRHLVFTGESNFHIGGLIGESKMFLEETVQAQLQAKTRFSFIGGQDSYVSWDCKGFKSISLEGSVEFCRDMIIPIDPGTGEGDSTSYVTGSFVTTMPEWGNFVATISVSPFALTQLPDWKWEVQNMIFDFSDVTTPEAVQFPEDYEHADVTEADADENYPTWTGFFLEAATVTLPNSLTGVEEGDEVTVGGENIIIDNTGFSAWIYGTELLPLEKGRMGTWAFSIDSLGVAIQSNHFENVAFAGEVDVPAFEKEFAYEAFIDPADEYFFKVIWQDTLTMDAFKAKVELHASSSIELQYKQAEKKYYAEAVLHGLTSFQPTTEGGNGLNIPYLTFQDLKLMSNDPYIELGSWQLEGELSATFGNFTTTICGFGITKDEQTNEVIIGFCAKVHLTGASGGELAADGYFRIIADIKYNETIRRQIWAFKDFKVDKLGIDASGPGYAFTGDIHFFEKDPTYGDGFRGALTATFEPKLEVGAVAQFGAVEQNDGAGDYKYFFVDALASYNPGITIGTSGLMLYGFGGGASYHMARSGFEQIVMPQEGSNPAPPEGIGVSLSGMTYVPNKDVGVGIKATVALGTVNRTLFNGIATLEFIFNNSGGLHQIGFDGTGKFLTQPASDPQLSCNLNMTYDFPAKAFHASLDVFVNVQNQITGAYENNYAGNGTLHIDPKDWYIYLGTPDAPMSLALNTEFIPKLDPLDISFGGYFDAGSLIPEFPGLPSNVTNILGEYTITKRDDPRFAGGNGILFGANINTELANLRYAVFYASFEAGAGWDMMLYDFGENARCAGNERSSQGIGIDGWYGTGQMYAYVQGSIGIYVDLFLVSGNFTILNIGAGAALQARLPNPMYMRGKVGGYFSILNGAVSGRCSFQFEAGEECTVVGQDVLSVDIISDTSPNLNANSEVDVFIRPQVTFNFAMGEQFMMLNEDGEQQLYRAALESFRLENLEDGSTVPGTIIWSEDQFVLGFKTEEILDPFTKYKMTVKVKVETRFYNTEWKTLEDTFGDPYFQSKEVEFETGAAPNYIPLENVAYSYPVHTQFNYHKQENINGYIQLIQGQDYLFDGSNNGEWVQKMRLIQDGTILQQYNLNYDASQNKVFFQVPADNLALDKITQLVMVAIPTSSEAAVDANVAMTETNLVYNQTGDNTANASPGEDFTSILIRQRALENQAQNLNEEIMITLNFRTSKYATFAEKMNAMNLDKEWKGFTSLSGSNSGGLVIDQFGQDWTNIEMFDKFEMHGYYNSEGEYIAPLIELKADMATTGIMNYESWYIDETYPSMSQHLPNSNIPITWRDASLFGNIPQKAILFRQIQDDNKVLTEQEIQANTPQFTADKVRVTYKVPYFMAKDYFQFRNDVSIFYSNQSMPQHMVNFLLWEFKRPYTGDYKVSIKYQRPGNQAIGNIEKIFKL